MKISNILFVSIQNILHKKRAYFKVLVGFFLVFLINFTIIFYAGSLSNAYILSFNALYLFAHFKKATHTSIEYRTLIH